MGITVLMPTRNGAAFLPDQLASLVAQQLLPGRLIVSDDGSTDTTRALLADFARTAPFPVLLRDGPRAGPAANALALIAAAPPGPVALCDQDDIWLPHKLARAAAQLPGGVALHSGTRLRADAHGRQIQTRPAPRGPPGFAHALLANAAPGNTVLLSAAGLALARSALPRSPVPFHDWWLYQLVTGCGGQVMLDPVAGLLYRQHPGQVIGAGTGLRGAARRARRLLDGSWGAWVRAQAVALEGAPLTTQAAALRRALLAGQYDLGPLPRPRRWAIAALGRL